MGNTPATASDRWYYRDNGAECGPFQLTEMQFLRDRGKVTRGTEIRRGEAEPWQVAGTCEDLFRPQRVRLVSATKAPSPENHRSGGGESQPGKTPAASGKSSADGSGPVVATPSRAVVPPPRRPIPSPQQPSGADGDRWKKIGLGTGIGVVCALLLLLLILLCWWLFPGDNQYGSQNVAQNGAGRTQAGGTAAGGGSDEINDAPSGAPAEIIEEDITEEAQAAAANRGAEQSTQRPQQEMVQQDPFGIQALTATDQPADVAMDSGGTGGGAAGQGSLGELNSRLQREGAGSGDVQISLTWDNFNDLDLHVFCPSGEELYYDNNRSRCGGWLDVDANAAGAVEDEPVENAFWPEGAAPRGTYRVYVHYFAQHDSRNATPFQVVVNYDGVTKRYSGSLSSGSPMQPVCEIDR